MNETELSDIYDEENEENILLGECANCGDKIPEGMSFCSGLCEAEYRETADFEAYQIDDLVSNGWKDDRGEY